jgi:hypothetical protein
MSGSLDEVEHLMCRTDRQRMLREPWSWKDEGRELAGKSELPVGHLGEKRDHHVLERNHSDAKVYQLGVGQLRDRRQLGVGKQASL